MVPLVPPKSQGLHSSTFIQPPLDFSLSFPALFDWQAKNSPAHPLFVFDDESGSERKIFWDEAVQGIHRATRLVRENVGKYPQSDSNGKPPLIAVLASSDTITFFSFIAGVMRTGWTLFPISTRNSAPAVAALLSQTKASHLFVSAEPSTQSLANAALNQLDSATAIKKLKMPVFEDLFPTEGRDPSFRPEPLADVDMDALALILHSSGTTAFPKPIYFTQKSLIVNSSFPCFGETDLAGSIFAVHAVPMFHAMGMILVLYAVTSGLVAAAFKPQSPAIIPNPVNVIKSVISLKSDYIFISPTFPETWSHDSSYVEALAQTKGIIFGGGPLSKEAGDYLVSRGVNVLSVLASTQVTGMSVFVQKPPREDWEYFQFSPIRETHFIDNGNNEYEAVILATETFRPNVINTTVDGQEAYATSDLVTPHPTKKGYWKIVGRTDDQIMHSTGEKTNPGPLEAMLSRDPFVHGAVIFGRGRFHCGILVQPKVPFAFDPSDMKKVVEFRNLIWPTIEAMNAYAPSHSRIFKEMILVTSPEKPLLYTPKGSLRRQAVLDKYAAEIDAIYAAVDESAQDDIAGPVDWSVPNTTDFVGKVIEKTLKKSGGNIPEDADLFEFGLDSLQATWIRNTLLRVLRETHPAVARKLSATFVYDNPTILGLSKYISANVTGTTAANSGGVEEKRRELQALVSKYTTAFPEFKPSPVRQLNRADGDVVLLTGSTGSLGSNILAKLIQNAGVVHVYTMSRPSSSGTSVKERHVAAFTREGLDVELLDDPKVEFLQGDPSHADLAIDPALYEEMQSSVTHVIHNAWRVNFNVAVTSFESNIRSVRNFVDFSLGGRGAVPAHVLFVSSVGVFQNFDGSSLGPEEHLARPDSALGTGYAESKWVSEQILQKASASTPLSTTVVRCGQMTGGPSGAWNDHEWFPSLIKSSIALGKVPIMEGFQTVSWITAYDAAGAAVDMLHADAERVLNLVHPRPVTWTSVIRTFSRAFDLQAVPYSEWFSALESVHTDLYADAPNADDVEKAHHDNPALRLLEFFRAALVNRGDNVEPMGIPKLSCEKAIAASQAMRDARCIGEDNVNKWVASWRKTGFVSWQ
ncbi:hypothetical protein M0805_002017 [Coniferiporia weirii]|nr:hypothetical protein M0805_002017 [Coniferiporia weirii]